MNHTIVFTQPSRVTMFYVKMYLWNPVGTLSLASILLGSWSSFAGILGMSCADQHWSCSVGQTLQAYQVRNSLAAMAVMVGAGAALQSFHNCCDCDFGCLICFARAAMAFGCIGQSKKDMAFMSLNSLQDGLKLFWQQFFPGITNISNTHPEKHIFIDLQMWCMAECIYKQSPRCSQPTHKPGLEVKPLMTSSCIASFPCRRPRQNGEQLKVRACAHTQIRHEVWSEFVSPRKNIGNISEPPIRPILLHGFVII